MKRFLILLILIAFSLVSCAGQTRWTKSDFSQDNLEEDWDRCIVTASYSLGKMPADECMKKKGYISLSKKDPYQIDEETREYLEVIGTLINPYFWAIVITKITIGLPIKLIVGLLEE